MNIEPVNSEQRLIVDRETKKYISDAGVFFGKKIKSIPVVYDLRGKTAGMYRVRNEERIIRYNPYLFSKYFEDNLANTVPHEVAHYIADIIYGMRNIKPHGWEWKNIMNYFKVVPSRTCNYDLAGIPVRQYKTYTYRCQCTVHPLTSRRHNQISRLSKQYYCRNCQCLLVLQTNNE